MATGSSYQGPLENYCGNYSTSIECREGIQSLLTYIILQLIDFIRQIHAFGLVDQVFIAEAFAFLTG